MRNIRLHIIGLLIVAFTSLQAGCSSATSTRDEEKVLHIEVRPSGELVVDGKTLPNTGALAPLVKDAQSKAKNVVAEIRAEPAAPQHSVMATIDALKKAGVVKFALDQRSTTAP